MLISAQIEITTPDEDRKRITIEGRFYKGYLEDWYWDADIMLSEDQAHRAVAGLYEAYEEREAA